MPRVDRPYKTIGIVGSRRRNSEADYNKTLAGFMALYSPGDRIVSGGCPEGADRFAEMIAEHVGVTITIHHPRKGDIDEALRAKNYRAAWAKINYARNTLIAQDCDVLLALVAPDRKGGTEDTIKKALHLGKEVIYA